MKHSMIKSVLLFGLCAFLFSFTKVGGDSYTIHLNGKIVAKHYVASNEATPSFSIDPAAVNDQLSVFYSECGQIGTQRSLILKDEKEGVLKEWQFANTQSEHAAMTCTVKDIIALKRKDSNKLKLYYASREVSKERMLAVIVVGGGVKAGK